MKSYWQVLLIYEYLYLKYLIVLMCVVMFVQIKKNVFIFEMMREVMLKEIDDCKFVYCGYGFFDEVDI